MKICHLTSVHSRYDTRIFLKECVSLVKSGFDVHFVVADNKGDELKRSVNIHDVGASTKGRASRILKTTKNVYLKAIELDADVYHFHDPEMMLYAYLLKRKGKKVIYDIHEDFPRQLLSKPYSNLFLRTIMSFFIEKIEHFCASKFDCLITATPFIRDRFLKINPNTTDVNNYPILDELHEDTEVKKKNQVCFIGGISEIRGIETLVRACEHIEGKLVLAGKFNNALFEQKIKALQAWKNVDFRGFVNREEAKQIMAESKAGIVTFLPLPNHINAQPNKMFEYMSASLPVICSDFPLWNSIVEKNDCGKCINPNSISELTDCINQFLKDDSLAQLGQNARAKVISSYSWGVEEKKLVKIYNFLN
jgi:glycosyltransferase involved in cell wall biosynthesis